MIVYEDLNSFVRNQDPKKSLGLGYEGKIRNFFRHYDIPDENYEVKESGEIVFHKDLELLGKDISELPDNLTINGSLDLKETNISQLPENLSVVGSLFLVGTNIIEFPNNLYIGNNLILGNTNITELPDNLIIDGYIYVNKNQKVLIKYIKQSKFKDQLVKW